MKLYNTLTRSLEPFTPLAPPSVTMYVCGPTVYDDPHIGHARSAFTFDVLRRYLAFKQYQVTFVRNVTDVDDKIIEKARSLGTGDKGQGTGNLAETCREVSQRYLKSYHAMLERLGIQPPDLEPKATEHINTTPDRAGFGSMTDLIAKLLMQGAAYEAKGDVYFAVRKHAGYGKLSHRAIDELQAGARIEPGEAKQDPLDFALWKAAKPGEPSWSSPWGQGRPGWHIECSAMSTKYLGDTFDIHGGGVDLVFPHHENEIAQAEAAGKPFARWWVHNGLLTVNGEKMSKSLGNFLTVEQTLADYPHPDYLKLFFLKAHYRSPIDYSRERMDEAKKNWNEFRDFLQHDEQAQRAHRFKGEFETTVSRFDDRFREAMDEDLNTPKALSVLFESLAFGQQALMQGGQEGLAKSRHAAMTILDFGMALGLFRQGISDEAPEMREKVQTLVQQRNELRQAKEFKKADAIREQLRLQGYHLMDTPLGTLWQRLE